MRILNRAKRTCVYVCSGTLYGPQPALPSCTGWTFSSGWVPAKSPGTLAHTLPCMHSRCCSSQERCSRWSWLLGFPSYPRAAGTGEHQVNPGAAFSAKSWALTSYCTAFSAVVLTQLIWDIGWQPKFAHTAASGPVVLICISLSMPKAYRCILRRFLLGCKGWRLELCKPTKEGENHLAPLAGKGNSLQTTDTTSQTLCFTLGALQLYSAYIALTETHSRDLTLFRIIES